ncbi:MAG: hypothetical protein E7L05_00480 [Clostridium sp.]|nr:hypothetical protein [Clostridium sp.]
MGYVAVKGGTKAIEESIERLKYERLKGKEIILLEQCILGDEYILYNGKDNIMFKSIPHNLESKNESSKA